MDWLKCNICFNKYNDTSQRPRSLSCGHTFCECCLKATIQNETLNCPRCRMKHKLNSVDQIPVNFDLEGIMKSLNLCSEGAESKPAEEEIQASAKSEIKDSLKSVLEQQERSLAGQKELLKSIAGICNDHPTNDLKFRCSLHKCWVCERCIQEQGDHPKDKCKITSFKEEIEARKQEHNKTLYIEGKQCDESLSTIDTHISNLKEEIKNHICLDDKLNSLVDMHTQNKDTLQNEITSFQSIIDDGAKLRKSLTVVESTVLSAETLDESNTTRDKVNNQTAAARNWGNVSNKKMEASKLIIERSTYSATATRTAIEYREKFVKDQNSMERSDYGLKGSKLQNSVNSDSSTSDKETSHQEEVTSLQEKVLHYRTVLADTEALLKSLQVSIEGEKQVWQKKMIEKDSKLKLFTEDNAYLNIQVKQLEARLVRSSSQTSITKNQQRREYSGGW